MSKKIGKYAVIVVLYIALVSTLAFIIGTINLIVNADSLEDNETGGVVYQNGYAPTYMRFINGTNGMICNSNDIFKYSFGDTDTYEYIDFFSSQTEIDEEEPTPTNTFNVIVNGAWATGSDIVLTYTLPSDLILGVSTFDDYFNSNRYEWVGSGNFPNYLYLDGSYVCLDLTLSFGVLTLSLRVANNIDSSLVSTSTIINSNFYCPYSAGGGVDDSGIDGPSASINYKQKDNNIMTLSNIIPLATTINLFQIERNNVATQELNVRTHANVVSTIQNGYSYNEFTDLYLYWDYPFVIQGNFNEQNLYYYNYSCDTDFEYLKTYSFKYFDTSGIVQEISLTFTNSFASGGQFSIVPTINEIKAELGADNVGDNDLFYISDLFVHITLNDYTDALSTFEWVGEREPEYENIRVNRPLQFYQVEDFNIGDFLLSSVNSFLGFELIPGFSLLSLLALVIGIPLLIYILKLFLGG